MIGIIVAVIFIIRLYFLKISRANEKRILQEGGKEFGVKNTKYITILHILFYASCVVEHFINGTMIDTIGIIGLVLLGFSIFMLNTVVHLLEGIWTVKLMLVKNHKFNNHWLFRTVKHPNYFLNIIPELVGLALLCHAKYTAIVIMPLYAIVLYRRIKEEEKILAEIIIPNGTY